MYLDFNFYSETFNSTVLNKLFLLEAHFYVSGLHKWNVLENKISYFFVFTYSRRDAKVTDIFVCFLQSNDYLFWVKKRGEDVISYSITEFH